MNMYVHAYVYIYIYIHIHTHTHTYIYIYIYVVHASLNVHVRGSSVHMCSLQIPSNSSSSGGRSRSRSRSRSTLGFSIRRQLNNFPLVPTITNGHRAIARYSWFFLTTSLCLFLLSTVCDGRCRMQKPAAAASIICSGLHLRG